MNPIESVKSSPYKLICTLRWSIEEYPIEIPDHWTRDDIKRMVEIAEVASKNGPVSKIHLAFDFSSSPDDEEPDEKIKT